MIWGEWRDKDWFIGKIIYRLEHQWGSKEWDLSRVMPCLLPWAQVAMHNMHACITSCEQSHLMEEHLFTQPQVPCCVPCQEKPPHCASIKSFHWHSFWNRKCVIFTIWGGGVGLQELFTSLAQAGSHPASAPIHRLDQILWVSWKNTCLAMFSFLCGSGSINIIRRLCDILFLLCL